MVREGENNNNEDSQMNEEILERILSNPEEQIPKIAEEFYPDDEEEQRIFRKEVWLVIETVFG